MAFENIHIMIRKEIIDLKFFLKKQGNKYVGIYKSYAVASSHLTRFPKPLRSSLSKSKKNNGFKN